MTRIDKGQFFGSDHSAPGNDHRPFDHVAKLPDISRPMVGTQKINRFVSKSSQGFSGFFGIALQEMIGEYGYVVQPLSEGRYINGDHVDTIVEIVSELFFFYQ